MTVDPMDDTHGGMTPNLGTFSSSSSLGIVAQLFRPTHRRPAKQLAANVRRSALALQSLSDPQLRTLAQDTRERIAEESVLRKRKDGDAAAHVVPVFALAFEAIRRQLGFELHNVQLQAAFGLVSGAAVEMQTGEGKTLSAFPAAVYRSMIGDHVQVATPNHYLAERDCQQLKSAYEALGICCNYLPEGADPSRTPAEVQRAKSAAYQADVLFGSGYEFGFDYLRDQIQLLQEADLPLGQKYLQRFSGLSAEHRTCTVGQDTAIIDELDHGLIDDADSPLVLSEAAPGPAPDRDAILLAKRIADTLNLGRDFERIGQAHVRLTDKTLERIHSAEISIPTQQLLRPWTNYITNALIALHGLRRDVEYVLEQDEIKLVDQSTGRIFEDRTWNEGLHQAVEAKEGLEPTPNTVPLVTLTRQKFFKRYRHLCGMSGTLTGCDLELKRIYELNLQVVPPRLPSRRKMLPLRSFGSAEAKWTAIRESVADLHRVGRPVLIGTNTIADSLLVAEHLKSAKIPFELLNGCQNREEAQIIAQAGNHHAVTIATNMAGRGTDIRLDSKARQLGGLHVIVSECHFLSRVDRQLVGRAARQGDPGSAQAFLSSEDVLLRTHAPWLGNFILRQAKQGEFSSDLTAQIHKIQRVIERERFLARLQRML